MKSPFLIFLLFSQVLFAQNIENRVLVIRNNNSPVSVAVANDYMARRNVPKVLDISCINSALFDYNETIDYASFVTQIKAPLLAYLNTFPEIDFIVLTKGIPIRITGVPGKTLNGTCSLDSYIAGMGYEASPSTSIVHVSDINYGASYSVDAYLNKYWQSTKHFTHAEFGGYLVTRLDGYTQADAIALTTHSLQAEANLCCGTPSTGNILLDTDPTAWMGYPNPDNQPYTFVPANYTAGQALTILYESAYGDINSDMKKARNILLASAIPVQYDSTLNFVGNTQALKGYFSWGSNDNHFSEPNYKSLTFIPGAIAESAVSTSARTFYHTSWGQSKIADLIAQGVTGVKGYTDEPLVQGIASPSILFDRYTKGWTLAESYYAASRLVSWMDIVLGDPICRAYANLQPFNTANESPAFSISPNPAASFIHVQLIGLPDQQTIQIYNSTGQVVKEFIIFNECKIALDGLSAGVYFVKLKNSVQQTHQFIKL